MATKSYSENTSSVQTPTDTAYMGIEQGGSGLTYMKKIQVGNLLSAERSRLTTLETNVTYLQNPTTAIAELEDTDVFIVNDISETKIKKMTKANVKEDLGINDKQDKAITIDEEATTVESAIQDLSDDKADVAQEDWIEPTLLNGWEENNSTSFPVRYRKNTIGQLEFKGLLNPSNITDRVIFTLPVGYRPTNWKYLTAQANGDTLTLVIQDNGDVRVTLYTVTQTWVSLDGLIIPLD